MNEVGPADRSRPLGSIDDRILSITTTRKRKFSQFFAVAAPTDTLPNHETANPNAPHSQPGEVGLPQYQDVFQGKNASGPPKLNHDGLANLLLSIGLWGSGTTTESGPNADAKTVPATPTPPLVPQAGGSAPEPKENKEKRLEAAQKPQAQAPASAQPGTEPLSDGRKAKTATVASQQTVASSRPTAVSIQPPTPRENGASGKDAKGPGLAESAPGRVVSPYVPPAKRRKTTPIETPGSADDGTKEGEASMPMGRDTDAGVTAESIPKGPEPPADEATDLSAKQQDGARPPDVVSSPGSTAPSATTPAIHDISTNTSPDNDGVQYHEQPSEEKEEKDGSGDVAMTEADTSEVAKASARGPSAQTTEAPQPPIQDEPAALPPPDQTTQLPIESQTPILPSTTPESSQSQARPPSVPAAIPQDGEKPSLPPKTSQSVQEMAEMAGPSGPRTEIPDSQEASPAPQMDVEKPSVEAEIHQTETIPKPSVDRSEPISATLRQTATPQPPAPEPTRTTERAVTRVSSGAIRQKSVSEILGEAPRPPPVADKMAATPKGPTSGRTPQPTPHNRGAITKRKLKDGRKQVSTVVFGKKARRTEEKAVAGAKQQEQDPADDYFTPLFIEAFTSRSNWMKPLGALLTSAHKTISSSDTQLALDDDQACKVLKRVYVAQHSNKWSLRQRERCPEPTRQPSHADVLLDEMKWMRTDFRYERKWKMAQARILAHACATWMAATPDERLTLQVPAVPPPRQPEGSSTDMDADAEAATSKPSRASGIMADEPEEAVEEELETVSPSAIFGLPEDQIVFHLHHSAAADMLLDNLPMYGSPLKVPRSDLLQPEYDPDASWRRPALPLSKYVEGDMKLVTDGQPSWKSAFDYDLESEDDEDEAEKKDAGARKKNWLPPEKTDCALFNPESRVIRDRLHAAHQFRPPSEHPMPPQSFYENRVASQWTQEEDDRLRGLIGQYSYNWPLISDILGTKSMFVSGAERRTAWECFERWLQLEPLSPDLAKTQYFRAYNQRIENAQRVITQQHQAAQQAATDNNLPPPKRRQCVPWRVDRRHNRRHINLFNAMTKVQKKRESVQQKQQAQANLVAMRKANEGSQAQLQPRNPALNNKTPRDYSLMRWERDQALAEKMAQYAQRHEAQRRQQALQARQAQASMAAANVAAAAAAASGQMPQNAAHLGQANGLAGVTSVAGRINVPNQFAMPNQARPGIPMQGSVNGMAGLPNHLQGGVMRQMPMNGVTPQLQAMQGQHRLPMAAGQQEAHVILAARRISEQQRQAVQMQQSQQPPQGQSTHQQQSQGAQQGPGTPVPQGSPPQMRNGINGINAQNFMSNAQSVLAASFNQGHGPPPLGTPPGAPLHMGAGAGLATSPRPHSTPMQLPAALANQIQALESQYRQKNPAATPEQARQYAMESLNRVLTQRQAMNAAAGAGSPPTMPNGLPGGASPAQYAALLRQQQQQHQAQQLAAAQAVQAAHAGAAQHQRNSSGSATPGK